MVLGVQVVRFVERNPMFLRSIPPCNDDLGARLDALGRVLPEGLDLTAVLNAEPPLFSEEPEGRGRGAPRVRSCRLAGHPTFLAISTACSDVEA
jgi:hypothetical protein